MAAKLGAATDYFEKNAAKVMAHLVFGVLALTFGQWLRLAANQT